MGFKVAVTLNGLPAGEVEVDVKPEHIYNAILSTGGSQSAVGVSYEQNEIELNLVAHLEAHGTRLDDVLVEKEQEKREIAEGLVKKVEKPIKSVKKSTTSKRVSAESVETALKSSKSKKKSK